MNDDQIKAMLHDLAAAAPSTDVWAQIRKRVPSRPPRRPFWPKLKLRPTLVGLDVVAIAALLVAMFLPGFVSPTANMGKPGPPAANSEHQYPLTLAQFVQLRGGKAGAMLPTALPSGYQLTDIYGRDTVEDTQSGSQTLTQTIKLRTWEIFYHKSIASYDKQEELSVEVDPQAQIIYAIDQRRRIPQGLDAIGKPGVDTQFEGQGMEAGRMTSRTFREDRVIELYHDSTQAPRSQFAAVYFDNHDTARTVTRFFIQAHTSISDDMLTRFADSLEPIDPQNLARYQFGGNAAQQPMGLTYHDDRSPSYSLADFVSRKAGDPDLMLPTYLPSGYKLEDIDAYGIFLAATAADGKTVTMTIHNKRWRANYALRSPDLLPKPLNIVVGARDPQTSSDQFYQSWMGGVDTSRRTASYQLTDRRIELYHNAVYAPDSQFAYVFITNPQGEIQVACTIQAQFSVSDDDLLKIATSITRVDPQHLERYP